MCVYACALAFEPGGIEFAGVGLEGVVVQVQVHFVAAVCAVAAHADDRAVADVAVQFEGVVADVVGFGVAVARFTQGERVVVDFDAAAQVAVCVFFFEV